MEERAPQAVHRLSWDEAHRLEVRLRARAGRLAASGNCPGCGRPVTGADQQIRLAGLALHCGCLGVYGDAA